MMFLIFSTLADATDYQAQVDHALGLPSLGENVGDGEHVVDAMTLHYADVIAHPTLAQWAFPLDGVVAGLAIAAPSATLATDLAGWFPSPFGVV
jgi:hypothetical protein